MHEWCRRSTKIQRQRLSLRRKLRQRAASTCQKRLLLTRLSMRPEAGSLTTRPGGQSFGRRKGRTLRADPTVRVRLPARGARKRIKRLRHGGSRLSSNGCQSAGYHSTEREACETRGIRTGRSRLQEMGLSWSLAWAAGSLDFSTVCRVRGQCRWRCALPCPWFKAFRQCGRMANDAVSAAYGRCC